MFCNYTKTNLQVSTRLMFRWLIYYGTFVVVANSVLYCMSKYEAPEMFCLPQPPFVALIMQIYQG